MHSVVRRRLSVAASRAVIIIALGAVALTANASPARAAGGGTIEGTVRLAHPAPPLPAVPVAKDVAICGHDAKSEAILVGKGGALRNVVVFVNDAPFAGPPAPTAGASLDQKQCRYVPHVQALTVGTPLSLMNNDAILHNIHANASGMTVFNVAMPIKGQKLPVPMRKPGLLKLQCDAGHSWMNGWIYVFEHPYFATTDDKGGFIIKDVPPGDYTLELWHEPADGQGPGARTTAKVKVSADKPAHLDLTLAL
jgi:plastocyanin